MVSKNIFSKLQAVRVELQNRNKKKSGQNKFAGFKYFELSDFIPEVNSLFREQNLTSCFNLYELEATLDIINTENPTEMITFRSPVPQSYELKGANAIQILGGTHTYLKRYLYLNALEIVENDMIDAAEPKVEPDTVKVEAPTKTKPGVQTSKPALSFDQTRNYLVRFLGQPERDHKKAYGWAQGVKGNPNIGVEDKKNLLASIDKVYGTNYVSEFEESFLA